MLGENRDFEELRKQQFRYPTSKKELERRWKAIREAMANAKLDCLVMNSDNPTFGGPLKYITDQAPGGYGISAVFPLEHGMTMISSNNPAPPYLPPDWAAYGMEERVTQPYFPSIPFTNDMAPKAVVDTIKRLKLKSIGIVQPAFMSAHFYEYLKKNLQGVTFKDATDLVDNIRAVKSEEEIKLMYQTAADYDAVMLAALAIIRPGVKEFELGNELKKLLLNMGHDQPILTGIGSAPKGTPVGFKSPINQNRTIQDGDVLTLLIEDVGRGGLWCELARQICVGDVPKALQKVWKDTVAVQKEDAKLLKPGTTAKDIFELNNKVLADLGYDPETRLLGHGQGYDIVERPSLQPWETMVIKKNMVVSVHPWLLTKEAMCLCDDDFLVTDSGSKIMSKCPQEVLVVG